MRINLVIASLNGGGAQRVMSKLANSWAERGEEITITTVDSLDSDFYEIDGRINRVALDLYSESESLWQAIRKNAVRLLRLRAAIRKSRADVIISFMDSTNVLTLISTIGLSPPVITSDRVDPRRHPVTGAWAFLRRKTYSWASATVVQTRELIDVLEEIVPRDKIRVIPNPAPGQESTVPQEVPFSLPLPFVLAMGRLHAQKGFDILLHAFARIERRAWSLVILGEGPERQKLTELAEKLGIAARVCMPGLVTEPNAILNQADLFVLSSRYEGFPNALVEAMSCGRAVISFDCPTGPGDILRNGVNGVLVPPEDSDALAIEIDRLLSDEKERERLGNQARLVSKEYSLEKIVSLWDQLIVDVQHAQI